MTLGKTFCIVGVMKTSQANVDGLVEQWDEMVPDVATVAAFLEISTGSVGQEQGVIKLSDCQ